MNLGAYAGAARKLPANPFYARVLPFLVPGRVLDAGSGVGTGSCWLLQQGFAVDALDADPEMVERAVSLCGEYERFHALNQRFVDPISDTYDNVLAVFSLFFEPQASFEAAWQNLTRALRVGGIFGGQLLGMRDDWIAQGASGLSEASALMLFRDFEILEWEEVERDGRTILGDQKHWHVFHVIARRLAV